MRRLTLLLLTLLAAFGLRAQSGDVLEYQQEIGGGVGIASYVGDAGGGFLTNPGLAASFIWRRNLNQRMVIKTNAAWGHISGDTKGVFIPEDPLSQTAAGGAAAQTIHFSRNVVDVAAQFELNFFGYGMGAAYKGLRRWTPYLLAGAGFCIGFGDGGETTGGLVLPLGAGLRYKIKPRVNVGFEWTIRFSSTDKLDHTHLEDPYGIRGDVFKNRDAYQLMLVTLTYDISPKLRKCNN
ncbi:MAG: outer membrane beta-barrel protein [Bacteroidaceae bacterium]|nr:outer membrane beta-barrel protein [Bacteroidaceae bacterium]